MTAFYRMRTNTALKRTTTLFAVLVRFSAKEYRQPMRSGNLLSNADSLRHGWHRRTMRKDYWADARATLRYNMWTKCKRRAVCLGSPMHSDRRSLTLCRALQRPVERVNTVYRTRPFRLRRFVRTAHT